MDAHVQTDDTSFSQVTEPDRIVNKETKNEVVKLQLNATSSSHK
jgi:hypothetical protein